MNDFYLQSLQDLFAQGAGGYGARMDNTMKGEGFFGPLTNGQGRPMTEYSMNEGNMVYPTMTPNQSFSDMNQMLMHGRISPEMAQKAWEHAESRRLTGRNPFANFAEEFRGYR